MDNFIATTDEGTAASPENSRGFFNKLSSRINAQNPVSLPSRKTKEALLLLQNYEETRQGWFWSTDDAGRLLYLTESVAEMLGKPSSALIGTPFIDLFTPAEGDAARQRTLPFILVKQSKFEELPLKAAGLQDERWWAVSGQPSSTAAAILPATVEAEWTSRRSDELTKTHRSLRNMIH